ncbi:Flp family type IVb pilin [Dietzia sp. E1]|nr:Flp family type IVb pilin [Dietzia sp. E1]MBB1021337.1 Flp family type IVb pilin [Dietzia sp. E1]
MSQAYYALVTLQAFFSDRLDNRKDRGATAVEYGLMVGLIAVAIIAVVIILGDNLESLFTGVGTKVGTAATEANAPTGG